MNEPTNAPMLPPPSGVSEWITVWREALTRPSELTFARIGQSPNAKLSTALIWVFVGSVVNFFLTSLVQGAVLRQFMQTSDFGLGETVPSTANTLVTAVCGAPIAAVMQVVLFVIIVGIVQLLARMFGGRGTFEQLAYALAAIVTPFYFISGLLSLLSAIPFAVYCFGVVGFLLGLYVLVLQVMAVKGVNQFGWGQALASMLLPVFAMACCLAAVVAGMVSILGPEFNNMFNSILTPVP